MATVSPVPGDQIGRQETLSEWAGPYVTSMLGKAEALSEQPYQVYQGPLTAEASPLQQQAFSGLARLSVSPHIGRAAETAGGIASRALGLADRGYAPATFTSGFKAPAAYNPLAAGNVYTATAAYQPGQFTSTFEAPEAYTPIGQSFTEEGIAGQYMNPYIQQALNPQLEELRRQAEIARVQNAGRMARAGAYGGGRQAIMESELGRNLLQQIGRTTGEAYTSAYDKAVQQFNAEQQRKLQEAQFGTTQDLTAAELAARYGQSAQQATEQSRQFAADQALKNAQLGAQFGFEGLRLGEQSRQFGAQQGLEGARLGAQFGLEAQRGTEQSRQFGANYGLDALARALAAAQTQGQFGQSLTAEQRANVLAQLQGGATQRGIESEGIKADYEEFKRQRDYPYAQLQFQQSMLQGMPVQSVAAQYQQPSTLTDVMNTTGGLMQLYKDLFPAQGTTKP